jgi:hypothetical protein
MSDETKEKLRIAHRGKKLSDKQKEILRQSHLGKKPTDEHKEKIRRANLGRKLNPEHVEKIRRASIGRVVSKETREKQRRAKLGNSIWLGKTHSEESKEKIRVANLGKSGFKHSQTSIEKMKMSKLGKVHSDQTKLKISQSKKGSKHNKVGVNNDDTIEYYGMLDNYLKDRGFSLNKDYLNLNFDKVGIFFEGSQIGDVSLRVSRNILHLRGLNFTNDNFKFVDVVYNFHLNQIMVKNLKVKIYTDIDNTIDSFKKTFKDFNLLKRCNKVTASPKKLWTTK